MTTLAAIRGRVTLALAVAFGFAACAAVASHAAEGTPADSAAASFDWDALQLERAVTERRLGHTHRVVGLLEGIDFERPRFAQADRAAFLLGQSYLELGSLDRFDSLAIQVSRWERQTAYSRWLGYLRLLLAAEGGVGGAAAGTLLRELAEATPGGADSPLALHLRAAGQIDAGQLDAGELELLSRTDPTTPLGRDLAAAALLKRAERTLERGGDPSAMLELVPAGSRYSSRARHLLGVVAYERGDGARAEAILDTLLARDPGYADRREVGLTLAAIAMESGRWRDARGRYADVDRDWSTHRDALQGILTRAAYDSLWTAWEADASRTGGMFLDATRALREAETLAAGATDLGGLPPAATPVLDGTPESGGQPWPVQPPPPTDYAALAASARARDQADYETARARHAAAMERARLGERARYLEVGVLRTGRERDLLLARATLLDSLRLGMMALDERLKGVRDEATRRVAARTESLLAGYRRHQDWMRAMRRFHLDGPHRERPLPVPAGHPGPDSVLAGEEALAAAADSIASRIGLEAPGLIARSYEQAWRPALVDRPDVLGREAADLLAWTRRLGVVFDSTLAATASSPRLVALEEDVRRLGGRADSLRAAHEALRARVAREAVERTLASLAREREGIDYGVAAAAYGVSVGLGRADSAAAPLIAGPGDLAAEPEDPADARTRREAIAALTTFTERHPASPLLSEARFRLADVLVIEERQRFRERMAAYVEAQGAGRPTGALPVMSVAPALALYRAVLAEDPGFEHRDAALFNAGMILADEGDPAAMKLFEELVAVFPSSAFAQETHLRMGDLLFDDGRFGDCITPYARATEGGDPSIAAVALYKTGWAQFNRERFAEAADAFRAVIDLHRARAGALRVDLDQEAEAYLVHSLARAGGAEAFAAYFDRIGPRPYEQALLRSLGQHLRRFSLYDGAAGADELALARFPLEADALLSARRLVETRDRAGDPARADASRLEVAPRFAPGSAWAAAQGSDSVRAAGADFARSAWRTVAERHHALGRERGSAADWREALRLHDTLRVRFPADPDRAGWQLLAGEAAFRLDDPAQALARYASAAEEGRDSIPAIARWQRVAVTDAWYESTRTAGRTGRTGIGRDSLALAVIARADEFLERHPDDPRGADLLWRQGQLALAHGWHEQALKPLEGLADRHPRDPRAPLARTLDAEALFKLGRFAEAGRAFEGALTAAREVGLDSLAARAREALPVCAYRRAEAAAAADSTAHERHARLYEEVATRWPDYVHAPDAQYRAGLAWMRAGRPREAIRVMQALALDHPKSGYLPDAQLTVARAWEQEGERERAADAYAQFAARHPRDASAGDAMLHAADLYAAAGATERAEALRMDYVRQHPEDVATAMELYETLAQRELRAVGPGRPLAALLPRAVPRTRKGSGAAAAAPKPTALATYLRMAADHPELASRELIGQVRFLEAEEAFEACSTIVLRQPLEKSIAARQKALDRTVAAYRRTAEAGAPGWANASAYRLGRSLVAFGEALEKSERPADLKGNDLEAYEDVLWEQAQAFFRRGEGVWDDLLRRKGREGADDPWIARARGAYQDRLAERLLFRPEVEYPLVEAERPAKVQRDETSGEPLSLAGGSRDNATVSDRGSRRP